jgi:hypothetical protein
MAEDKKKKNPPKSPKERLAKSLRLNLIRRKETQRKKQQLNKAGL